MAINTPVMFKLTRKWLLMMTSLGIVAITGVISNTPITQAQTPEPQLQPQPQPVEPQIGPPIFNSSSAAVIELAKHLTSVKARFFGVWWCKYCTVQKELLGREAMTHIQYVECDIRGLNPKRDLCIASQVPAFPTWEIKGNHYTGVQTLEQLADISGYAGDRKF